MKMKEQDMKTALRDIAPGFVSFFIKAADTDKNVDIHEGFKEFARVECAGDYTKALDKLLSYYVDDAKFESMWEYMKCIRIEIDELKIQLEEAKYKEPVNEQEESAAF